MKLVRFCTRLAALSAFLAALPAASPQATAPQTHAQESKSKGTGVVPPGVKLSPTMPPGAPPKPFTFPKAATKTLANGLRVFVITDREQPAVTLRLVLTAAGAIHDPAGKPGVAAMTANLLDQGTSKRSAQDIAAAIDFVGGSLSARADSEGTSITATAVKKDFDLAVDLLTDVALNASFQAEELDRRRQQLLSNLRVQYADADYLASALFDRAVFGSHPYALPNEGTPESVNQLTRDDLVKFRDTYFAPSHTLLAIAGDISPEAAFAAAEKHLGAWPRKDLPSTSLASPAAPSGAGHRIYIIDKPDAVQTQIRFGRLGIRRNDPDFIPLLVTNQVFGGGFNSRLSTQVRINKGLTYGAYSSFNSLKTAGSFLAATSTRTEATIEATRLVLDLIAQMGGTGSKPAPVTRAELDFARDFLAGVFPVQSETGEQVAGRLLTVAQYDLPADYNDTYPQKVLGVTPEQVAAMGQRYFSGKNLTLVLVGNAKEFREAVKKEFAGAQFEEMTFDQIDLLAPDMRRAKEVRAAATPERVARGKQVLAPAVEAAGGAAVTKVQSVSLTATGEFISPQGPFSGQIKLQIRYPDLRRMELDLPFGVIQQGFDGKAGWIASTQGVMDLPTEHKAQLQREIELVGGWGLYRRALAGEIELVDAGEGEFNGRKARVLEWNAESGLVKLFFDVESRLLVGARYRAITLQGPFETEQRWSDFRAVDGFQIPFRWVTLRDGAPFSDYKLGDVKLNTNPDPSIFSKPK